jgi:hypothetical protein
VAERAIVNVSLKTETKESEEVVVIGYQSVKSKDLVGAVASIGAKQLKDIPVNSAAEAIAGKLPWRSGKCFRRRAGCGCGHLCSRTELHHAKRFSLVYIVDGVQVENALAVHIAAGYRERGRAERCGLYRHLWRARLERRIHHHYQRRKKYRR